MSKTAFEFKFVDLPVKVARTALYGSVGLIVLATVAAKLLTSLSLLDALIAGILAMLLHWFGEVLHQYGHYRAGKRVKYPATGVYLWWILGTTLYPRDEVSLPAKTHIQRALGGPLISTLFTLLAALALWQFGGYSPMLQFLLGFMVLEGIFIFAGGAIFPLRIGTFETDGGTILRYWRQA